VNLNTATLSKNPTQCDLIVECFNRHGGSATLGELLTEGQFTFAHKLTARLSDLRKLGYSITCTPGPNPSQNRYTMTPPQQFQFDDTGQGVFA
jgi:hypothetical protein